MGSFLKTTAGGTGTTIPNPNAAEQLFVSTGSGSADTNSKWLPKGTTGQVIQLDGTGNIIWATLPAGTTDTVFKMPPTTATNQLLISNAIGDPHAIAGSSTGAGGTSEWLDTGTAGQVLTVATGGKPTWTTLPSGTTDTVFKLPDATKANQLFISNGLGDVHTSTGSSTGAGDKGEWKDAGAEGTSLTVGASGLDWVAKQNKLDNVDAVGDLLVGTGTGDAATNADWLTKGTDGQFLSSTASGLAWATLPAGTTDTVFKLPDADNAGQIFISNGTGDVHATAGSSAGAGGKGEWLDLGTKGQVLTVNAAADDIEWSTPDTYIKLTNPTNKARILASTGNGDVDTNHEWVAPGTNGQILSVDANGDLDWITLPAGTTDTVFKMPSPDKTNQLLISNGAGDPHAITGSSAGAGGKTEWLDAGTAGQVLQIATGGTPEWATLPSGTTDTVFKMPPATKTNQILITNGTGDVHATAGSSTGAEGKSQWMDAGAEATSLTVGASGLEWVAKQNKLPNVGNAGDLLVGSGTGDSATNAAWLTKGTTGQILTATASGLGWTTPAAGTTDTVFKMPAPDKTNQLLISNGAGDPHTSTGSSTGAGDKSEWLDAGTAGQVLQIATGGKPEWATLPAGTTDTFYRLPDATKANQLFVSNGLGDVHATATSSTGAGGKGDWVDAGATGTSLTVGTSGLEWIAKQNQLPLTDGTAGVKLFFVVDSGSATDPATGGAYLDPGTNGQILTMNAALEPTWTTPAAGTTDTVFKMPSPDKTNQLLISNGAGDPHTSTGSSTGAGDKSEWIDTGTDGQVLTVGTGGKPTWTTLPTGATDTVFKMPEPDKANQLLISNGAGDPHATTGSSAGAGGKSEWIDAGTAGQVLTSTATGFSWNTPAVYTSLSNPATKARILASTGNGAVDSNHEWVAPGTSGQLLSVDAAGDLVWITPAAGSTDTFYRLPDATGAGAMLVASGTGDVHKSTTSTSGGDNAAWLAKGTAGQVLSATATSVAWVDATVNTDQRLPNPDKTKQVLVSNGAGDPHDSTNSVGGSPGDKTDWEDENDFIMRNLDGKATDSAVKDYTGTDDLNFASSAGLILGSNSSVKSSRNIELFKKKVFSPAYAVFALPLHTAEPRNAGVVLTAGQRHDIVGLADGFNATGSQGGTKPPVSTATVPIEPIRFLDGSIYLYRGGVYTITFAATLGLKMVASSLSTNPTTGNPIPDPVTNQPTVRDYHKRSLFSPTLSFKVVEGVSTAYEVRGTQNIISLLHDQVYYNETDVSVITTATITCGSGAQITPRMHWFSSFQMGVAEIEMTATRSTAMFCSILEVARPQDYYGAV